MVRRILRALSGLEYGSVEIIVQDSKVVQIERTQRSRFPKPLEIPENLIEGDVGWEVISYWC
ncbi:MAG: YezD family protein [Verrucomicrobiota bacterium]